MQATLSHYRILEQIGQGGMGVVYRARDERLERDVALKVLLPGALSDETARLRFRKEALALSKLSHTNIATVYDFDSDEGADFLVEELIEGLSLDEMLVAGPLPEKEIVNLGSQLCEGLAAAHKRGVVHRDLKPGNIRVTPDARLKIFDFGLAKVLRTMALGSDAEVTTALTQPHTVFGTLPYMAPEQLLGEKVDARTDIWAIGCVLHEMATGRRPFAGAGPALVDAILHQPAPAASALNPAVSPELEKIIAKCLKKDPALRYATAREIAADLHRLTLSSPAALPAVQPRLSQRRVFQLTAALVALSIVLATAVYRLTADRPAAPAPTLATPSIAVLPFVDMSPDRDQEYFADGLTEELLNRLARTPRLRVVARTSSFQFKGRNAKLPDIGRELNVATILEGSVRKQANHVRITAQLINASDGFHVWSETYDRELTDIFVVQEEIARSVAGALKVTLLRGERPSPRGTSQEAYNAYLLGRYFYQRSSKENLEKAVSYYRQAVQLDPRYAPAWVGLAQAHSRQSDWGYLAVDEGYSKAREAVSHALILNPDSAEAHAAIGWINMVYERDWKAADASYQRALAIEPSNSTVVYGTAVLAWGLGQIDKAIALFQQAVELDPLNPQIHVDLAAAAYCAGRYQEGVASLRKALDLDPQRPYVHTLLGQLFLAQSRAEESLAEMQREPDANWRLFGLTLADFALRRKDDSDAALAELVATYGKLNAFQIAEAYAFRGETDRAFEWLERACVLHDSGCVLVKADPLLSGLRRDPRYTALLRKMRLPE